QIAVHFAAERRIGLGIGVGFFQIENQRHQRLGNEAAAVDAEVPALVGTGAKRIGLLNGHLTPPHPTVLRAVDLSPKGRGEEEESLASAARAALTKARIFSGSFSPGARSTPDDTSTAPARVIATASPTLAASRPPDSMNGTARRRFS